MEYYGIFSYFVIWLCILVKSSDLSPLPKFPAYIQYPEQNSIIFPDSETVGNGNIENELFSQHTFYFRKNFRNKDATNTIAPSTEEIVPRKTYLDKIIFGHDSGHRRNHLGYIRRFADQKQKNSVELRIASPEDVNDQSYTVDNGENAVPGPSGKGLTETKTSINERDSAGIPAVTNVVRHQAKEEVMTESISDQTANTVASISSDSVAESERLPMQQRQNSTHDQITFLSLFRTPNIEDGLSADGTQASSAPCPENFRRDHHGRCRRPVRRIRYRIIQEDV